MNKPKLSPQYTVEELRQMILGLTWEQLLEADGYLKVRTVWFEASFGQHLLHPAVAVMAQKQFVAIKWYDLTGGPSPIRSYGTVPFRVKQNGNAYMFSKITVDELQIPWDLKEYVVGPDPAKKWRLSRTEHKRVQYSKYLRGPYS